MRPSATRAPVYLHLYTILLRAASKLSCSCLDRGGLLPSARGRGRGGGRETVPQREGVWLPAWTAVRSLPSRVVVISETI